MANNITTGGLNFLTTIAPRTIRLIGSVLPGEIDGRSLLNDATKVAAIYVKRNGRYEVFKPNNLFSTTKIIESGEGIAVAAIVAFESEFFFPLPNTAKQTQALNAIGEILDPPALDQTVQTRLPNLPLSKRSDVAFAAELAASTRPWTAITAIDTLSSVRSWLSFEFASTTLAQLNQIKSVISWGNATDGLEQLSSSFQPLLTLSGAEFSVNPPAWMSYNGEFLSNTNFTLFVVERRDALNAGWILGGSATADNANLQIGYSSPTTFSFNRTGGNALNYTVPATLSNDFRYWALQFDGATRSIWLNGVKVAEVVDTVALGSYTGSAIGYNYEPSYIGKVRHYLISTAAMPEIQINQIVSFLQFYTGLYPSSPDELASGTISVTQPLPNASISVDATGTAQLLIEGSFALEEDSAPLKAIEYSFANGIYKTIVSNPANASFLVSRIESPAIGNLIVRFKDNPEVSAIVSNVSVVDARVTGLTALVNGKIITANWSAPAGVTILNYFVEISSDAGATWGERQSIAVGTNTCQFTNRIGGSYLVRVQTVIDTSVSAWVVLGSPAVVAPTPLATVKSNLLADAQSIWRFDDSTADAKSVGNFITTGTITYGAALASTGSTGAAIFDGSSYLRDSLTTRYLLNGDQSIVFLAKNTGTNLSTTRIAPLVNKRDNFPGNRSWFIGLESSTSGDRINLGYSSDGNSNTATIVSPWFPAGTPLLTIVQYSKGNFFRLKVNNGNWVDLGPVTASTRNYGLAVGASFRQGVIEAGLFIGVLDFLLFFNRILDGEEVPYFWNNGNGAGSITQI